MVDTRSLSRRSFLVLASALSVFAGSGCPRPRKQGVVVYRRSGRGLHVSRAALKHAANHLYKTRRAAQGDAAHPGDNAKVVPVTIAQDQYRRLFRFGQVRADLRHV